MIRRTLIIGWHEFIKYVTRRGFLISLVMIPLVMVVAGTVSGLKASHPRTNVMTVVDLAGGYGEAIGAAAAREQARRELGALADYASRYADRRAVKAKDATLAGLLQSPDRIASITAFAARGGWRPAFAVLSPLLKPGAPAFEAPKPDVVLVPPPQGLVDDFAAGRHESARMYLEGVETLTGGAFTRINSIVVVPQGFGPGNAVAAQYWSIDSQQSTELVRWALNDAFRLKVNQALMPPEARAKATLDVDAALTNIDPAKGRKTDWKDQVARLVPMGLAFLLFIVAFSDAALLLQSVIEEKSTRMIEVLLSCAGPHEIMTGKLIGVTGLALVTLAAWIGVGLVFSSFVSGDTLSIVATGLKEVAPMLPLVLLYFFCGLLIYSSIFLGIGATSNSLPDAQALMGPATMIIVLPNMVMGVLIQDPNGTLAQVISWIPIYTPFFMLVRLPFHPAPFELWATAFLTLATTVLLIRQMGKVFASHVLTSERPPSFGTLFGRLFGRLFGAKKSL